MWLPPCIYSAFAVRRPPFQAPFPRSISLPPPQRKGPNGRPRDWRRNRHTRLLVPARRPLPARRCQRVLAVLGSADSGLLGRRQSTVLRTARSITRSLPPVPCLSCLLRGSE